MKLDERVANVVGLRAKREKRGQKDERAHAEECSTEAMLEALERSQLLGSSHFQTQR